MDRAKTLLNEALDADSIGLKEVALKTYLQSMNALLKEPKISLDQLIFEDDFDIKEKLIEDSKKCLEMAEKCLGRASDLFCEIEENHETEFSSNANNHQLRRSSSSTSVTKKPLDLSQVRRQFEKATLAEIIARQKRQGSVTATTASPSKPAQPQGFSINLQMISDLLNQRHHTISQFNEKLLALFDLKSAIAEDDIWRKTLKIYISSLNNNVSQPIGPIIGLLSHPSHPISQISRDFVLRLKHLTLSGHGVEDFKTKSKQISTEYHQFSFQMIKLLRHNYGEELASGSLDLNLQITIENFIFSHLPGLGTGIQELFLKSHQEDDNFFLEKLCKLSWANFEAEEDETLFNILGIPQKYRVSLWKYGSAVNDLKTAVIQTCPSQKAFALVKVCESICSIYSPNNEDSSIGSEVLVLLFSFVIIQAQISNMESLFALISEFIPEDLIRGHAGYILATLQTCIDYIKSLN